MTRYSVQPRDRMFVKGYELFSFAKNIVKAKTVKAIADLIGNKSSYKITKVSKTSPYGNSETVTNEEENIGPDRDMPKKRYISPCYK